MLSLDTPLPTPSGWTVIGDISVGDQVFDESGLPCTVTGVFDGIAEEAYRLHFSDGTTIDACADHQWVSWTHAERKSFLRSPYEDCTRFPEDWPAWRLKKHIGRSSQGPHVYENSSGPQVRTTRDIINTLKHGKRGDTNHCIPTCGPLQLRPRRYSIDPYVLGVWLGDGTSTCNEVCSADPWISEEIQRRGEDCYRSSKSSSKSFQYMLSDGLGPQRDVVTGRFVSDPYSFKSRLCDMGLISNKHVPSHYLRGSEVQRLDLLRGLMDTDGGPTSSNMVEFCNTNYKLVEAVVELARSLGQKPRVYSGRAKLYGKDCSPKWRVVWRPTIDVFGLPRKSQGIDLKKRQSLRNHHRMIIRSEKIEKQPMRCISVDSKNRMYLCGEGMIPTHNTTLGANWIVEQALAYPDSTWAVLAPTFRDTRVTCFEGSSGVLSALDEGEIKGWRRNELQLTLVNGSSIFGYSADQPERIRGSNLWGCWSDEICSWRYPATWYEGLMPALRKGPHPRVVATTTPRVTPLIRDLVSRKDGSVHITRGSTWENKDNLSAAAIAELRHRYEGSRLGRQELEGELLEDVEGALWSRDQIESDRVNLTDLPELIRIVVAIDPAVTSTEGSDETGIVVVGEGRGGHGYVLADYSMRGSPDACMRRTVAAYHEFNADCIVAEVNNGGDYIKSLLHTVDPNVGYRSVRASRGKALRAQPVASLYEQHRVHHVGCFPELEDQMTTWVIDDPSSPDRLDALVYAITELRGLSGGSWFDVYGVQECQECGKVIARTEGRIQCPHCYAFLTDGISMPTWAP